MWGTDLKFSKDKNGLICELESHSKDDDKQSLWISHHTVFHTHTMALGVTLVVF